VEVRRTGLDEPVDQLVRDLVNPVLHLGDTARCEGPVDQPALLAMGGIVAVGERQGPGGDARAVPEPARPPVGRAQYGIDVVVTAHHVVRW
jgi:hypothetical protein